MYIFDKFHNGHINLQIGIKNIKRISAMGRWRSILIGHTIWPINNSSSPEREVLCASSRDGACDHLDCHCGHFLVVVVDNKFLAQLAYVYSSEEGTWSGPPTDALQLDPGGSIIFLEQSEL
jgi:hypothetical protein